MADVWSGSLSPARVWGFAERLLDEPWSRYRAKILGGKKWREHLGWSKETDLMALTADLLAVGNSIADAHRVNKKPRLPKPLLRPTAKSADPDREWSAEELRAAEAELNS